MLGGDLFDGNAMSGRTGQAAREVRQETEVPNAN
jgi:hypothetical protein